MKIIAIIPARGGSKRIKHKNIVNLNGKPLIAFTIEAAKDSNITNVIISTDNKHIAHTIHPFRCSVLRRPKRLATANSPTEATMLHILKMVDAKQFDAVMLLQPTSPLRTAMHINEAIKKFEKSKANSLVSVCKPFHHFMWRGKKPLNYDPQKRPMGQNIKQDYSENGAIYITKIDKFLECKCRIIPPVAIYEMDRWDSLEIDEEKDLEIVRLIIKNEGSLRSS